MAAELVRAAKSENAGEPERLRLVCKKFHVKIEASQTIMLNLV